MTGVQVVYRQGASWLCTLVCLCQSLSHVQQVDGFTSLTHSRHQTQHSESFMHHLCHQCPVKTVLFFIRQPVIDLEAVCQRVINRIVLIIVRLWVTFQQAVSGQGEKDGFHARRVESYCEKVGWITSRIIILLCFVHWTLSGWSNMFIMFCLGLHLFTIVITRKAIVYSEWLGLGQFRPWLR